MVRTWFCILAVALVAATTPVAAARQRTTVVEDADSITLSTGAYQLDIARDGLRMVTSRAGETALAGGPRFQVSGTTHQPRRLTGWSFTAGVLTVHATSSLDGATITARVTPGADRYALNWEVAGAEKLGMVYELASGRHWYGHGEIVGQPFPLETGRIRNEAFSPASYDMQEPFWYTATGAGLWVRTGKVMDVRINDNDDGLGRFFVQDPGPYEATVFVERTAVEAYRDYVGEVGRPLKSDATYEQYAKPLWNSWAQFYTKVDQPKLLEYAEGLHRNDIGGHTIQLDDKWEAAYGDLTFDPKTFPDPRGLSDRIHELGFDFGIWVTLWINTDAANHKYAADNGFLLKNAEGKPCTVRWWNGEAGIVDLANPAARAWYTANLRKLMADYRVDGFKFDTAFFNDACTPYPGFQRADYQRLGAELADEFDLQGAGIRVHWSGPQKYGFVTRTVDHGTDFGQLAASVRQTLQVSALGYPFTETDMIGGSLGWAPPSKEVLVRWAEAAALMPLMYSSTSPVGTYDNTTGKWVTYDEETIRLYREAVQRHEKLAPYLWRQVQRTLRTGDPIMRPVFFDFPDDRRFETVGDQWMLGPAVLTAPLVKPGTSRDVLLPRGTWYDVNHGTTITGPVQLTNYPAPLGVTPAFVRLGAPDAALARYALTRDDVPAAGVTVGHDGDTVTVSTKNWSRTTLRDVRTSLTAPAGWQVEPTGPGTIRRLRPGETATSAWRVTPLADARWGPATLTATAEYGDEKVLARHDIQFEPEPGPVSLRTHATTDARFGQRGDQLAIWSAGRDLSGWVDEKGVLYQPDAFTTQAVTRLVGQDGGEQPAAKAGLAVANDLTAPQLGGYAVLVMTKQHGVEFMWDGDGNGVLDGWAGGGASTHPVWLKLTRAGTTYTAYTSADGTAWQQVGTARVPSAAGTGDAGVVASAVNAYFPGATTRALFEGFSVS